MGTVIVIPADDSQPVETRDTDQQPGLPELQKIVGGYIEVVPHWDTHLDRECVVYCNEEGKLNELPINMRATVAWYQAIGGRVDDVLVGNVVMVVDLPDKEEDE
jgi:hypothetical protein